MSLRVLLIGRGRMGRLVEQLAPDHGCEIVGIITARSGPRAIADGDFGHVDVAIDFSRAEAMSTNLPQLAVRQINVVIGTTGWQTLEPVMKEIVSQSAIGVLASANFSLGAYLFRHVVAQAAKRFSGHPEFGAWIHEAHHKGKKDAPSGTALSLKTAMEQSGYTTKIDVSSTRAGWFPGTHEIGFDGPAESITLTHEVRDRSVFAHGALAGANWLKGRKGWFTFSDMLGG
jgi:4-hydroxy-tetrahydrodipicolinate reductase